MNFYSIPKLYLTQGANFDHQYDYFLVNWELSPRNETHLKEIVMINWQEFFREVIVELQSKKQDWKVIRRSNTE